MAIKMAVYVFLYDIQSFSWPSNFLAFPDIQTEILLKFC